MMILSLLAAVATAAAPAAPPDPVSGPPRPNAEIRFSDCIRRIAEDPEKAIDEADAWRAMGGGVPARHCLGLAFSAAGRWLPAALAFEQAAREADTQKDGRAANLWVQSGNAYLAADDPAKARLALDRALALAVLSDVMRGEALMDRARADVAADDLAAARADLDAALKLVPQDPMGWLLSAALARRQGLFDRAEADIAQAAKLAPADPEVAQERSRITQMRSAFEAARTAP